MIALLYSKIFQYIKVQTNQIHVHRQNTCVWTKYMYVSAPCQNCVGVCVQVHQNEKLKENYVLI